MSSKTKLKTYCDKCKKEDVLLVKVISSGKDELWCIGCVVEVAAVQIIADRFRTNGVLDKEQ